MKIQNVQGVVKPGDLTLEAAKTAGPQAATERLGAGLDEAKLGP